MGLRGGCDIIVATPGRFLDLLEHNALRLGGVQTLVLTRPTACWTWASARN